MTKLARFVPSPIILNLNQTNSTASSMHSPPVSPSIWNESSRGRISNPFQIGFMQIQKEIALVLLPAAERFEEFEALIGREAGFFTLEVIKDELAVEDRIDAMIDRAVKRIVQTKAMKQMLGVTSADRGSDQPKSLLSNKPQEISKNPR